MKKLDITYQYRLSNSSADLAAALSEVDTRKADMNGHYEELCRQMLPMINSVIEDYYTQNPQLFPQRLELAPVDSSIWRDLPRQKEEIQKTFYLGEESARYTILQQIVELRKRLYVTSLYGGNILFKYSKKQRQICFDAVNTLASRMLAAASNGNMHLVMVDFNEMEGTCNIFKSLNKGVFQVVSQYNEFTQMLDAEASRTENIIQNLLQGEIYTIAEYNQSKTEKVPYTLLVLKDMPIGYGNDVGVKLAKLMRSGPRAGVSVVALVDEEEVNR